MTQVNSANQILVRTGSRRLANTQFRFAIELVKANVKRPDNAPLWPLPP